MIAKPFDEISGADIQALVTSGVPEDRTLEYKENLYTNSDRDKFELTADVSSLANTNGGDIIIGIPEIRINGKPSGRPEKIVGVSVQNEAAEIERIMNLTTYLLDPKIPGLRAKFISGVAPLPVVIVRVPNSWNKPHMITMKTNHPRFYLRTDLGKQPLDIYGIRSLFSLSESLNERLHKFRNERLSTLLANEGPAEISHNDPFALIHLVSAGALDLRTRIDPTQESLRNNIIPLSVPGWNWRLNFDGLLNHAERNGVAVSYAQTFRNGAIELFDSTCCGRRDEPDPLLGAAYFEKQLMQHLPSYLKTLGEAGLSFPYFLMITFARMKGLRIPMPVSYGYRVFPIEKEFLFLPDVIINSSEEDLPQILKPPFDSLWQACDIKGSFNYDPDGKWNPKFR